MKSNNHVTVIESGLDGNAMFMEEDQEECGIDYVSIRRTASKIMAKKNGNAFLWEITKLLDDVDQITWISRKHLSRRETKGNTGRRCFKRQTSFESGVIGLVHTFNIGAYNNGLEEGLTIQQKIIIADDTTSF